MSSAKNGQNRPSGKSFPTVKAVYVAGLLAFLAIGLALLNLERYLGAAAHELGVLFLTVVPILYVYEFVMRRHGQDENKKVIVDALREADLRDDIIDGMTAMTPKSVHHVVNEGVADVFGGLERIHLVSRIEKASNQEIVVSNIWIPDLNQGIPPKLFIDAIMRNCRFKFLISDTEDNPIIKMRATSKGSSVEEYVGGIVQNLNFLNRLSLELAKVNKQAALEVRVHNDFTPCALWGFKNEYIMALYLHQVSAIKSTQFKIIKKRTLRSSDKTIYNELDQTFWWQWGHAYKNVIFGKSGYLTARRA